MTYYYSEGQRIERYHHCPRCGWQRFLTTVQSELDTVVESPAYGRTTIRHLARFDVLNHNCDAYREAKGRMKEYLDGLPRPIGYRRDLAGSQENSVLQESV